ncbi:MAG: hypothetical protein KAH33_04870 [Candidatus Delongbacteria bacterium]|nr:hypothetical protein [Candidatus Delongbacteria bacterium]
MKHKIILFLMLISLIFISCDSDYSGEVSDSFNMYYAVDGGDSLLLYSLDLYVNSTNGTIKVDSLRSNYVSNAFEVVESDSFYMKLTNFNDSTLYVFVYKGRSIFANDTLFGVDSLELKGKFNQ